MERVPGEPPVRFPFQRGLVRDTYAWMTACPNFYWHDVAYSKERYKLVTWLGGKSPQTVVDRVTGERVEPENAVAEKEDTDAVLQAFEHWRRRYSRKEYFARRMFEHDEPRPRWSHKAPAASELTPTILPMDFMNPRR